MKVLVTGGAGFVGAEVTGWLLGMGHSVRVLDNLSTGDRDAVDERAEFVLGDVRIVEDLMVSMPDVTHVVHLAGVVCDGKVLDHHHDAMVTNVIGTGNVCLVAEAAGVRRMVFSSSAAVYGDVDRLPISESATMSPISAYGYQKCAAEEAIRSSGVPFTILRYFNAYGPRKSNNVIAKFARSVRLGEPVVIRGDGYQIRDYVHVDGVARATVAALFAPEANNKTINVGTGVGTSVLGVLDYIERNAEAKAVVTHEDAPEWEIRDSIASVELLGALLLRGQRLSPGIRWSETGND